jgi:hypothetical protein
MLGGNPLGACAVGEHAGNQQLLARRRVPHQKLKHFMMPAMMGNFLRRLIESKRPLVDRSTASLKSYTR